MKNMKVKATIKKHLKDSVNYLVGNGYEVKFKNINKIIDEVNEIFLKASSITQIPIIPLITINIEMFLDEENIFNGEIIFTTDSDKLDVNYYKIKKNDFDFEIEKQKDLVGTGKISFELVVEDYCKDKALPFFQTLKENNKFFENFEIIEDSVEVVLEAPIKFKVVKYLI